MVLSSMPVESVHSIEVARMGSIFFGGIAEPQQSDRADELRNMPRIALLTGTPRHGLRQQHQLSISQLSRADRGINGSRASWLVQDVPEG